ncbi:MAG: NIPSNAP family protein [Hyphomicrobiaceae bacterium]|nr:NIPSNAP family protein [Hyphomicrobiaceae bacterium]
MIYEFRTYTLHVRTMPEFLSRFGEALPRRLELSPLAACWYTELGPLNQIIHVWPYRDMNERTRIRAEAVASGVWPPKVAELVAEMRSEILQPLPFSPELEPSQHGPFFEMRSYTLRAGGIPEMAAKWERHLPPRLALSPLIGVYTSDIGGLNQWVHIWAYTSLDQRMAVRTAMQERGIWPPPPPVPTLTQEAKIMLPAPFSPVR